MKGRTWRSDERRTTTSRSYTYSSPVTGSMWIVSWHREVRAGAHGYRCSGVGRVHCKGVGLQTLPSRRLRSASCCGGSVRHDPFNTTMGGVVPCRPGAIGPWWMHPGLCSTVAHVCHVFHTIVALGRIWRVSCENSTRPRAYAIDSDIICATLLGGAIVVRHLLLPRLR
jgi:hypothetical protein